MDFNELKVKTRLAIIEHELEELLEIATWLRSLSRSRDEAAEIVKNLQMQEVQFRISALKRAKIMYQSFAERKKHKLW